METPNNRAGQVTEFVMAKVREKLPDLETYKYNRVYEAVYHVLESELPNGKTPTFDLRLSDLRS